MYNLPHLPRSPQLTCPEGSVWREGLEVELKGRGEPQILHLLTKRQVLFPKERYYFHFTDEDMETQKG